MVIDYGKIIFGGVDSSDYGIYISGEGVYNAPERNVEFVKVPGRNGDIAIDQGRYENIKVTYPAMVLEDDQEHFREKLSEFRNAILSQKGYQRLEDSYHPDEFRMGVYHDGLEVSEILTMAQGGNFELKFNCKPQRWLSVGALPIPVDSGDVLQNPTVFEASPLLEIEGYGEINFNGFDVALQNAVIGNIQLLPRKYESNGGAISKTYSFDRDLLNTGDTVTVNPIVFRHNFYITNAVLIRETYSISSGNTITPTVEVPPYSATTQGSVIYADITAPAFTFGALGANDSPIDKTATIVLTATTGGGSTITATVDFHIICGYDYITISMSGTCSASGIQQWPDWYFRSSPVTAVSTLNILGHPTYIDCEIGEAYRIVGGSLQSLNSYVDLGSDLPKLAPNSNTVTFDNTITDLKIIPRWWRI